MSSRCYDGLKCPMRHGAEPPPPTAAAPPRAPGRAMQPTPKQPLLQPVGRIVTGQPVGRVWLRFCSFWGVGIRCFGSCCFFFSWFEVVLFGQEISGVLLMVFQMMIMMWTWGWHLADSHGPDSQDEADSNGSNCPDSDSQDEADSDGSNCQDSGSQDWAVSLLQAPRCQNKRAECLFLFTFHHIAPWAFKSKVQKAAVWFHSESPASNIQKCKKPPKAWTKNLEALVFGFKKHLFVTSGHCRWSRAPKLSEEGLVLRGSQVRESPWAGGVGWGDEQETSAGWRRSGAAGGLVWKKSMEGLEKKRS